MYCVHVPAGLANAKVVDVSAEGDALKVGGVLACSQLQESAAAGLQMQALACHNGWHVRQGRAAAMQGMAAGFGWVQANKVTAAAAGPRV